MAAVIWVTYRQSYNKTVPAPVDKDTPNAPWWYDHVGKQCATYAAAGYDAIMLPPVCKTQSGSTSGGDGYGMFDDYDIGSKDQCFSIPTRFGTREQLLRLCAVANANGLDVYHDMVPHQRIGGSYGKYRYVCAGQKMTSEHMEKVESGHESYRIMLQDLMERYTRHSAQVGESPPPRNEGLPLPTFTKLKDAAAVSELTGRFPKDKGCFWGGKISDGYAAHDIVAGDPDWGFGDAFSRVNHGKDTPPGYVQTQLKLAGDWLFKTTGAAGCRIDDTKGQNAGMVKDWCDYGAMAGKYMVGEFADGNADNLRAWCNNSIFDRQQGVEGRCSAFDFDAHYNKIKAMCENPGRFDMRRLTQGFMQMSPMQAATFVDNPDTDTNGFAPVRFRKMMGYAMIMTMEGRPFVYYKDRSRDKGCYGLQDQIDNLAWIQRKLANGPTSFRYVDNDLIVYERTGFPGLLCGLNNAGGGGWRQQWVKTNFGPNVKLHDYTGHGDDLWTDANGWVNLGVPRGDDRGLGYVCYAREELEGDITVVGRDAVQSVFGAADLDIDALRDGKSTRLGRIWVKGGTKMRFHLKLERPAGKSEVTVIVEGPDNLVVGRVENLLNDQRCYVGATRDGWHTVSLFYVAGVRGNAVQPFELEQVYRAPRSVA